MSEFAWFKTFKSFKPFNPHLCPPPRRGGGIKGGGWNDWNFLNYLNGFALYNPIHQAVDSPLSTETLR